MRKTNGIFVVQKFFEKLDFFPTTYQKSCLYDANIEQISKSKC